MKLERTYKTPDTYGNLKRRMGLAYQRQKDIDAGMTPKEASRYARAADEFAEGKVDRDHLLEGLRAAALEIRHLHDADRVLEQRIGKLEKRQRKMRKRVKKLWKAANRTFDKGWDKAKEDSRGN